MDAFARDVSEKGIKFGRVWLDIEGTEWGACSHNVQYVFDLYHRLKEKGFSVGVYANIYTWGTIMCNARFKDAPPLWYPHYEVRAIGRGTMMATTRCCSYMCVCTVAAEPVV